MILAIGKGQSFNSTLVRVEGSAGIEMLLIIVEVSIPYWFE